MADKVVDTIDVGTYGYVDLRSGHVYVTPNSYFSPGGTATADVQRAIDAASSGDTVHIEGGSYTGSANTSGKSLTLELGASPAQVTINGDLTLDGDDTLHLEINGLNPATDLDNFVVNGTVDLGGAILDTADSTIVATNGQSVTIVDNDGMLDPVTGTFAGLANGDTLMVNGQLFAIFYDGGDGNDVVLTRIPRARRRPSCS